MESYQTKEYWEDRTERGIKANKLDDMIFESNIFNEFTDVARQVLERIPYEWSVLDVGCGYGRFSQHIRGEYTGIDFSKNMIDLARQKFPGKNFICTNIDDFKGKYDCVIEVNSALVLRNNDFNEVEKLLDRFATRCIILIESHDIRVKFSNQFYADKKRDNTR